MAKEKKSETVKPEIAPASGSEESTFITVGDGVNETTSIMKWGAIIVLIILVVGMVYVARTTGAISWFTNSSNYSSGAQNYRQVVQETTYPTEANQGVIEVDDTPTDIPIVVPSGKRIVFRTVNGKTIFVRDRSWDEWIAIEPGKKSRAPDQFTYPQARADNGEKAYVYYFLR